MSRRMASSIKLRRIRLTRSLWDDQQGLAGANVHPSWCALVLPMTGLPAQWRRLPDSFQLEFSILASPFQITLISSSMTPSVGSWSPLRMICLCPKLSMSATTVLHSCHLHTSSLLHKQRCPWCPNHASPKKANALCSSPAPLPSPVPTWCRHVSDQGTGYQVIQWICLGPQPHLWRRAAIPLFFRA